jgi:hypothetical protein
MMLTRAMTMIEAEYDDEYYDDDDVWTGICRVASKHAGVTVEQARAILAEAGQTAGNHNGIVEAVETVLWTVRHKRLPPGWR